MPKNTDGFMRTVAENIIEAPQAHVLLPKQFVNTLKVGDTTPSVANYQKLICSGASVTITDFKHGQEGQSLDIYGDGATTIANNAHITTNTDEDKLLENGKAYRFTRFLGKWVEQVGGGGGASTGGGIVARNDVTFSTASIADGAQANGTVALGMAFIPIKVVVDKACRVRLYQTAAAALLDADREPGTLPSGEHGLILDLRLDDTTGLEWDVIDPPTGTDMEETPTGDISYIVTNESGSTANVEVIITRLLLEAA